MESSTGTPADGHGLPKARTGIKGFDDVTGGGLPRGRPTLVTGAAGAGKTLFGLEFLVRGARDFGEPGVLLSFEEPYEDLVANVASLGFDLPALEREGLLAIDAFHLDPSEIVETGAFDLEGLFIRLAAAAESVGARRVVLDTVEVLFGALPNEALVRGELGRLFRWLKERGLTTVVTGERGRGGQLSRFGIEEYVSDCVVVLDHRVSEEVSTRRMRVVKYRGSLHGSNEYPFLITDRGLAVLPLTSVSLDYPASRERVSTGVERLDEMLNGGVFRGSTTMVSGSAGTGKTSIAAHMVDAACRRGETAIFYSLEESPEQLLRNMESIGLDLARWTEAGLLHLFSSRPSTSGLEDHLLTLQRMVDELQPSLVVLDAVGNLLKAGDVGQAASVIARDLDVLKSAGATAVLTTLAHGESESTDMAVSSLVDTWLLLRNVESNGERNRLLFVIKSRGTPHSNQVREFLLTAQGARLVDVSIGPAGVLLGSARAEQHARDQAALAVRERDAHLRRQDLQRRRAEVEAQIATLRAQLDRETAELDLADAAVVESEHAGSVERATLEQQRTAGPNARPGRGSG